MLMKHKGNMGNSHDMFLIFNQGRQMPGSFSVGLGYCGPTLLFGESRGSCLGDGIQRSFS